MHDAPKQNYIANDFVKETGPCCVSTSEGINRPGNGKYYSAMLWFWRSWHLSLSSNYVNKHLHHFSCVRLHACIMYDVSSARVLQVAWCDFVEFQKAVRFRYASTCHSMWFQCQKMTSFWLRTSQHRAVRVQGRNLNQWRAVVIWMVEHHSASIGIHPSRLSDAQSRHSRVWGLDELPVRVVKADLDINAYTFISYYI